MGVAVFFGLVLIAVIIFALVTGYMVYGIYLGLAALGRQCGRVWRMLKSEDADSLDSTRASGELAAGCNVGRQGKGPHCWEIKGCSPAVRQSCPAFRRPDLPCWEAHLQDGPDFRLKPECLTCKHFNLTSLVM